MIGPFWDRQEGGSQVTWIVEEPGDERATTPKGGPVGTEEERNLH